MRAVCLRHGAHLGLPPGPSVWRLPATELPMSARVDAAASAPCSAPSSESSGSDCASCPVRRHTHGMRRMHC